MTHFADPAPPAARGGHVLFHAHDHEWTEWGAQINPNGTHSSLWSCALCPDIVVGGHVGPIPAGYCRCGWVQQSPGRRKCEECKQPLEEQR